LAGVEEKLIHLRLKLWRTRGRNSRVTGAVFLIISGLFLSLAYLTRYIVFEMTSILALFLGVIFVLSGVERYMKSRVANRAVLSYLYILRDLLNHFGIDSQGIYVPTVEGDSVKIFLPKNRSNSLPDISEATSSAVVSENGLILPPVGNALLQLYEEELGDILSFDLDYLKEWLPRVLVDGLKMVEKSEITQDGEDIHVKLTDSSFSELCQNKGVAQVCRTIGCPVSSSIAEAIAKNTGQVVYYVNCVYDPSTRTTEVTYKLGPTLKDLRKENTETPQERG
jgi:hypothetical protein